jgi:hypothetical protein
MNALMESYFESHKQGINKFCKEKCRDLLLRLAGILASWALQG